MILINEETLEVTTAEPKNDENEMPLQRGWSSGCTFSEENKNILLVFGGLTGNDDNPKRLNDLWTCFLFS